MSNLYPDRTGWATGPLSELPFEGPFPDFTPFESYVLQELASEFESHEHVFREQLRHAQVIDRINTGAGFYTRVKIEPSSCPALSYRQQGSHFDVADVEHGIGIVLWGDEGYLDTIEGYTYGDVSLVGRELSGLHILASAP
ncbi:hypothetical protein [Asticcacaulis sp. W401b]|uniref:hypothetical protein n=1 Tax=Asticcacaulis sp. W401b TaxID=3388666 RepID=UPI003970B0FF